MTQRSTTIQNLNEIFWERCDVQHVHQCWEWRGPTGYGGYGIVYLKDGTHERAHRVAYMLATRYSLQKHDTIRHTCNNRRCVNPHHLTKSKHTPPILSKEANGRSKLTSVQRFRAAFMREGGASYGHIGRILGVHKSTIYRLLKNKH